MQILQRADNNHGCQESPVVSAECKLELKVTVYDFSTEILNTVQSLTLRANGLVAKEKQETSVIKLHLFLHLMYEEE
jgi:hypothetical protein